MISEEMSALVEILLRGVNVTNSEVQSHRWAGDIMRQLKERGYEIVPIKA